MTKLWTYWYRRPKARWLKASEHTYFTLLVLVTSEPWNHEGWQLACSIIDKP